MVCVVSLGQRQVVFVVRLAEDWEVTLGSTAQKCKFWQKETQLARCNHPEGGGECGKHTSPKVQTLSVSKCRHCAWVLSALRHIHSPWSVSTQLHRHARQRRCTGMLNSTVARQRSSTGMPTSTVAWQHRWTGMRKHLGAKLHRCQGMPTSTVARQHSCTTAQVHRHAQASRCKARPVPRHAQLL
eukprot:1156239-Pelagomonas_calceolata.AAC.1